MSHKIPAVYIITNKRNGTLYTGVTSNLIQRIYQHKHGVIDGFAKKYDCHLLIYYEVGENMIAAIEREKQLKKMSRIKKIRLIEDMNPAWDDLYEALLGLDRDAFARDDGVRVVIQGATASPVIQVV